MRITSVVFILLAVGFSALAQTSKGFVVGNVFDPSEAVIAGADVKITNTSTGVTRTTVSGSDGSFRLDAVDPGTYKVEVSQIGFKTAVRDNVRCRCFPNRVDYIPTRIRYTIRGGERHRWC